MRNDLQEAARVLARFMGSRPLTATISDLEYALETASDATVPEIAERYRVDQALLQAATTVRREFGRISDVIHAAAIVLLLPSILEPGEVLSNRPSLAAGNDPSRPFDLETNRRVAEFKFSMWDAGSNAIRKRGVFKDLVGLASEASGRRLELYVVGSRPEQFLRTTTSTASWGLDRSPGAFRKHFETTFGPLSMSISAFRAGPGQRVKVIDVSRLLPSGVLTAIRDLDEV